MATVEQVLQTNKNTVQAIYKKLENMYMYVHETSILSVVMGKVMVLENGG